MVLETLAVINVCSFLSNTDLASADTGASFLCRRKKGQLRNINTTPALDVDVCIERHMKVEDGGGDTLCCTEADNLMVLCAPLPS